MPALRRAVITGAPGAGKSTLLAALAARGCEIVEEAARAILREPGGMELRETDPDGFAAAMLSADMQAFNAAAQGCVTVYDRGFPDIVGFLRLEGRIIPGALDRTCRELRYDGPVFRAVPWREIYHPDEERIQDWNQAVASDRAVCRAWRDHGYELVDLPFADVATRVGFVEKRLDDG